MSSYESISARETTPASAGEWDLFTETSLGLAGSIEASSCGRRQNFGISVLESMDILSACASRSRSCERMGSIVVKAALPGGDGVGEAGGLPRARSCFGSGEELAFTEDAGGVAVLGTASRCTPRR